MYTTKRKQRIACSSNYCLSEPPNSFVTAFPRINLRLLPYFCFLPSLLFSPVGNAQFAMNFSGGTVDSIVHGSNGIPNQTPMTDIGPGNGGETVIDPDTGQAYWHYIIGDPASGFAEEVYIRKGGVCYGGQGTCSASGGAEGVNLAVGINPFAPSATSGNGTGNPNSVSVRMVLGGSWNAATNTWTCDTGFCQEFLKNTDVNKPKITQGVSDAEFSSKFVLDMSGIALSNSAANIAIIGGDAAPTGASLSLVQTLKDTSTGNVFNSFDLANNGQTTYVNGGQYRYVGGSGRAGSSGTYVYVDGQYDPTTVDYSVFFDKTVDNPWAYPAFKPQ